MPAPLRFSRRALLSSLPLAALPLLYGCGGGGGSEGENDTEEIISRAAGPLVVNGETIAQLRLVQTERSDQSRSGDYGPSFSSRLFVENTGTRTIADLRLFLVNSVGFFSQAITFSAIEPGQLREQSVPFLYEIITSVDPLVSRLQFAGEPALGGPYSGVAGGDFTVTGEQNQTGSVYALVGIDNRIRGSVGVYGPTISTGGYGTIIGTVDAEGDITATLNNRENPVSPALSGTLRTEGDGLRFEFSTTPSFSGAERFSALLQRRVL